MEAAVRPLSPRTENERLQVLVEHPFVIPGSSSRPTSSEVVAPAPARNEQPSFSTTLPRLASIRGSNNSTPDETERWGTGEPVQPQPDNAEDGAARRNSESFAGPMLRGDSLAEREVVVLTPSRLRLDSRVVFAHATLQWLTNAVWAILIWQKLEGRITCSWWGVFSPTLVNHSLHIPLQILVLLSANRMVYKQIGPPPPLHASPGLVLQYAILHHVRVRSHRVDWANNALESTAVFITKCLFCAALHSGSLGSYPLRLMFTPIWACWVMTVALLCLKDRSERMFGSSRDLFFIFLLFVAFKVDDQSSYSWRVVFLVPWMWFSGLLLVAAVVLLLLLFAHVWARPRELALPIGFLCLLLSTLPQFLSYIALVRRLDGNTDTSIATIMWPNALSWFLMWLSGGLIAWALRQKETVRDALLARGAVWTAHEAVARRLHEAERNEAQRRVDELSEDEVSRLVANMMAGKTKPGRLQRVGENLYKRIASLEPALAEQAAQAATSGDSTSAQSPGSTCSGDPAVPSPTGATTALRPSSSRASRAICPTPLPGGDPLTATTTGPGGAARPASATVSGPAVLGSSSPGAAAHVPALAAIGRPNRVVPLGIPPATTTADGSAGVQGPGAAAASAAAGAVEGSAATSQGSAVAAGRSGRSGRWILGGTSAGRAGPPGAGGGIQPSGPAVTAVTPPPRPLSGRGDGAASAGGAGRLGRASRVEDGTSGSGAGGQPRGSQGPPPSLDGLPQRPPGSAGARPRGGPPSPQPLAGSEGGSGGAAAAAAANVLPHTIGSGPAAAGSGAAAAEAPRQRPRMFAELTGREGATAAAAQARPAAAGAGARAGAAGGSSTPRRPGAEVEGPAAAAPAVTPCPSAAPSATAAAGTRTASAGGGSDGTTSSRDRGTGGGSSGVGDAPLGTPGQPRIREGPEAAAAAGGISPPSAPAGGLTEQGSAALPPPHRRSPAVLPAAEADGEAAAAAAAAAPAAGTSAPAAAVGAAVDDASSPAGGSGTPGEAATAAAATAAEEEEEEEEAATPVVDREDGRQHGPADEQPRAAGDGGGVAGPSGPLPAAAGAAAGDEEQDNACVICYDNEASCVFLECGHGGFCRRCAFLLFVRPPNECPTCRSVIDQVVEIEPGADVGQVAKVK